MPGALGRRINHDPRSRAYSFKAAAGTAYRSVQHTSHIGILDQGNLGSCTGNATIGALGCNPFFGTIPLSVKLDESEAVGIYSAATQLDDAPGSYPPDDTGSDGLSVAKAAQKAGLISGYQHAFTVGDALAALQQVPVIVGISWYSSFDQPSAAGVVAITRAATVRGGHEVCADAWDADRQQVWFRNSWGIGWGVQGRFCMDLSTFTRLLAEQGDVTVFVPLTSPPPSPTPAPSPADVDLAAWWSATKTWAYARHVGSNAAAAKAALAYAATKGL